MKTIHSYFLISILCLFSVVVNAEEKLTKDRFYQEIPIKEKKLVLVINQSGTVVINTTNTNTIQIAATRTIQNDRQEISKRLLQTHPIEVIQSDHQVVIQSKIEKAIPFNYTTNFTITIPKDLKIDVHTTNGQIIYNSDKLPYIVAADPKVDVSIENLTVISSEKEIQRHSESLQKSRYYKWGGISIYPMIKWWKSLKDEIPIQW
ncbi:MAG: hypothetical protein N2450_06045 [bacterium]|nr:hypothetical protein [bacterium]